MSPVYSNEFTIEVTPPPPCSSTDFDRATGLRNVPEITQTVKASHDSSIGKFVVELSPNADSSCIQTVRAAKYHIWFGSINSRPSHVPTVGEPLTHYVMSYQFD